MVHNIQKSFNKFFGEKTHNFQTKYVAYVVWWAIAGYTDKWQCLEQFPSVFVNTTAAISKAEGLSDK